jgi:uncharacterized protein YjbJ (UPF0337 family)
MSSFIIVNVGRSTPNGREKRRRQPHPDTARYLAEQLTIQPLEESVMNWDRIEGNWKQVTGKVKEQWGKLTDDDITVIDGKQEQLVGRIQERYGVAKDEAEKQVNNWIGRM